MRVFGLIFIVVVATWSWLAHKQYYPVSKVKIYGNLNHVPHSQITNLIKTEVDKSWFKLNLLKIKSNITKLNWLDSVKLKRQWPDKLVINLTEKSPLAILNDKAVLMANGELFYPKPLSKKLKTLDLIPHFYAPITRKAELITKYNGFMRLLKKNKLSIKRLEITPDGVWSLSLTNGFKIFLGKIELIPRLTRLLLAYRAQLREHKQSINYVDMRYINGLAIGWKTGATRPIMGKVIK